MLDDIQVLGREGTLATQNKVLRNTYMMLGLTMIPTVIGAMVGVNMNFAWMMAASPIMLFIGVMATVYACLGLWLKTLIMRRVFGCYLGLPFC